MPISFPFLTPYTLNTYLRCTKSDRQLNVYTNNLHQCAVNVKGHLCEKQALIESLKVIGIQ